METGLCPSAGNEHASCEKDKKRILLWPKNCFPAFFPPFFIKIDSYYVLLQVRAAPPPPKQHARRQQEKGDKTEEVEITLVWQAEKLAAL